MKVKKYVGVNTQEIMTKLKSELGSEAIILNTRTIKQKGFLGFFKKPLIEVVAAVDDNYVKSNKSSEPDLNNISCELKKLRTLVKELSINANTEEEKFNEDLIKYKELLVNNGVNSYIATTILNRIDEQVNLKEKTEEQVRKIIYYNIKEYLGSVRPIDVTNIPKTIFFVGPTGVGKTTTLAKIASQLVLEGKYKIGLVTADTYRIAAVDQLKTYSEILKLPLKVIYKPEEIYMALAELKDKDIILVDTAGISHKDTSQINETKELLSYVKNKEVYLVLSMVTDFLTLNSIIDKYSFISDYKMIFTKTDEAVGYGNVLNVRFQTSSSLSYFTTGQNVPEDIEVVSIEKVANHLIGEK